MEYLKVIWIHDFDDEPVLLYSELDEGRNEVRKVEIFRDDSFGLASDNFEFGGTMLSTEPIPSINEIEEDTQFIPQIMNENDFKYIWDRYNNFLKNK